MKTQKQISAAVVYRISDKSGTCLGYKVPSDTEGVAPYEVTYNYSAHRYECTCKDHQNRHHDCKHIKAVIEVVEARKQPSTTPLVEVMEAAQVAMVLDEAEAYDGEMTYAHTALLKKYLAESIIGDAYEQIAETKQTGLAETYDPKWYRR